MKNVATVMKPGGLPRVELYGVVARLIARGPYGESVSVALDGVVNGDDRRRFNSIELGIRGKPLPYLTFDVGGFYLRSTIRWEKSPGERDGEDLHHDENVGVAATTGSKQRRSSMPGHDQRRDREPLRTVQSLRERDAAGDEIKAGAPRGRHNMRLMIKSK